MPKLKNNYTMPEEFILTPGGIRLKSLVHKIEPGTIELRPMIKIDIFKENHRSSERTLHPAPHSVVGAANLAADGRAASRSDFGSLWSGLSNQTGD